MRIVIKRAPDGKITLQEGAGIAVITISRPEARNALTTAMWKELGRTAAEIQENPKNKVVVVRGVPGNFTAGSDIKEFAGMTTEEADNAFRTMEKTIAAFENLKMPVIGAIDGPVYGAGFILSLTFSLRLGTKHTKMGIPVAKLGIRLGPEFLERIDRFLGSHRTKELLLMSEIYGHETAARLGLLNRIVEREALDKEVLELAGSITKLSKGSVDALFAPEAYGTFHYADETDFREGCRAFMEKRVPDFPSRRRRS
ncbi:enoyl-CoA hydratase/isomerase family protein [Alkalicoccus luteus]|uniref:enoyl-CoA hydratase/isomerase family protein n=1 Tax=Alkalicoccus luteus TaxID=1237094 RepID=UPI0040331C31